MAADRDSRILSGPLALEIGRFGTPLALGMALQTTFNLVDAYLIARLPAGEVGAAVGAIGICDQVSALGTIVSYGVSTAAATILSQRKGAGDQVGIQSAAWQSMIIIGALSLVLGLVGGLGAGFIVRDLIGAKGDVATVATSYLRIMTAGSFSIFFLLQLTNVQRALGSAKTPVALLVGGNVFNVLLAVLFIFGPGPAPGFLGWATSIAQALHIPRMGMVGAAWAAVIARVLVLLPNVIILARRFDVFPPKGKRAPDLAEIKRIASIAWPSSAQFFLRISAMLFVNSLVARFFTTQQDQTATTAMGLVFRLDTMALFVAMGWGTAAQTFVGQSLGAQKSERAKRSGWVTVGYDAVTNVLLIAIVFAYGEAILRVFDDEAAPVAIALSYLQTVAPSYVALGVGIVLGNAMAGAGATRTTFAIDAVVILALQVPLGIVVMGVLHGSLAALFQCVAVVNVASAVAYATVYARGTWLGAVARTR
jgi:putative MATE family efflux protein